MIDVIAVLEQFLLQSLFQFEAFFADLRQAVDRIHHQMIAIQIVQHRHIKGRGDRALFLIAAYMNIFMVAAPISEPMD